MLHLAAPYCCSSFKLHYFCFIFFMSQCFHHELFLWCTLFISHRFLCCNVFMLYLLCALFILHLFSCCTIFPLHFFFCSTLFMLQFFMLHFFQFGPSLLTCFLFYSFHDFIFHCCFFSHCTLFRLLFSSCTVFL